MSRKFRPRVVPTWAPVPRTVLHLHPMLLVGFEGYECGCSYRVADPKMVCAACGSCEECCTCWSELTDSERW